MKTLKILGQNKVKICELYSQNFVFLGQKIGCPSDGTVELPLNVTSRDLKKSVVVGELPLQPNYNKSFLRLLFNSMPKSGKG